MYNVYRTFLRGGVNMWISGWFGGAWPPQKWNSIQTPNYSPPYISTNLHQWGVVSFCFRPMRGEAPQNKMDWKKVIDSSFDWFGDKKKIEKKKKVIYIFFPPGSEYKYSYAVSYGGIISICPGPMWIKGLPAEFNSYNFNSNP